MFANSASALDFQERYEENAKQELATGALSLETWIVLQRCWSEKTFGPAYRRGPLGPTKHLLKEVRDEVIPLLESLDTSKAQVTEELIDCIFLIFDAAWRAGLSAMDIRKALTAKLVKNRQRTWPDWRTADPKAAVEHDRSKDTKETK